MPISGAEKKDGRMPVMMTFPPHGRPLPSASIDAEADANQDPLVAAVPTATAATHCAGKPITRRAWTRDRPRNGNARG